MKNRITGVVFHTAGVVMLTLAYKEYYSALSRASKFFKGAPPEKVIILLAVGAICTLFGLYKIFRPGKR